MLSFIVEGGVPAEVLGRNVHSGSDVVAVCAQERTPRLGVVIAQTCGVLPVEGDDVCPHISGVVLQFRHGLVQIHTALVTEQPVVTQTLRSGTGGDVPGIALRGLHLRPVLLQRQSNKGRGVGFRGMLYVVLILQQIFGVGKILYQLCDELLLLAGRRTVIRDDLHPLPRCDVLHVSARTLTDAALDIRALDDQSCHGSSSSSRSFCTSDTLPLVFFTLATLSAR